MMADKDDAMDCSIIGGNKLQILNNSHLLTKIGNGWFFLVLADQVVLDKGPLSGVTEVFELHSVCSWCVKKYKCDVFAVGVSGDRCSEQEGNRHFCSSSTASRIPENPDTACTGTREKV